MYSALSLRSGSGNGSGAGAGVGVGAGGGVETTMITVAPAAPSLDLLPGWETQHIESDLLENNDIFPFPFNSDREGIEQLSSYTDRVVSLSLRPGEKRVEYVFAVLQPLLTGVFPVFQDSLAQQSSKKDRDMSNGNGNGCGDDDGDDDGCMVADDMRITVHQWISTPSSSSSSSSSSFFSPHILDGAIHHTENVLSRSTSLQRDFLGPLKNNNPRNKPNNSSDVNCKLIRIIKSKGRKNGKYTSNNGEIDAIKDMPSSLSLPLEFEFEFSRGVVGYRIDVETLALNSSQICSSTPASASVTAPTPSISSTKDGKSPLYLRK